MKNYLIPTALLFIMALSSCTKTIDEDLSGNERSLLELRVEGQMGTAIIDRDGSRATATVYILETPGFAYKTAQTKYCKLFLHSYSSSLTNHNLFRRKCPHLFLQIYLSGK